MSIDFHTEPSVSPNRLFQKELITTAADVVAAKTLNFPHFPSNLSLSAQCGYWRCGAWDNFRCRIEILLQAKIARSCTFSWIYIAICFESIQGANWTQFCAIVPIPPDVISAHLCLTDWSWCWLVCVPPWTSQL